MTVERVYVGDDEVYVPDLNRWVSPGDKVEFDTDPDSPLFLTEAAAKKATKAPAKTEEN